MKLVSKNVLTQLCKIYFCRSRSNKLESHCSQGTRPVDLRSTTLKDGKYTPSLKNGRGMS